jgi:hypothetical protein
MSGLAEFFTRLLHEGKAVLQERPESPPAARGEAIGVLRQAFESYRLSVAGPRIEFDEEAALAAAELVRWACWYTVRRDEPAVELEDRLTIHRLPSSPAQHLSADVAMRFLPQVYRRARALAPSDPLPGSLAKVLRQWPLTGILSDVAEEPLTPLEFGHHPGLLILYAERLATNQKPAWFPKTDFAYEFVELVFVQQGQGDVAALHRPATSDIVSDSGGHADARAR